MKTNRPFLLLFFFCLLSSSIFAQSGFQLPHGVRYMEGQILFKINAESESQCQKDKIDLAGLNFLLKKIGSKNLHRAFPTQVLAASKRQGLPDIHLIYEITYSGDYEMEDAINILLAHPQLVYAEPRYMHESFYQPNDVWADTTFGTDFMWHLDQIRAREAWDLEKGNKNVVIGITDSGISFDHPDLKTNLYVNSAELLDGIDNDGDSYVDNYRGWDFGGVTGSGLGDNDPTWTTDAHGVAVTGIPSATADNLIGVSGIGFNCSYLPVKASPDNFPGAITHGYEAILYCAQHDADIINCSWGSQARSQVGEDIIDYVVQAYDVAIIVACGNTARDIRFYPAAYDEVLSVTNIHFSDSLCCPAVWSPNASNHAAATFNYSVDVAAPGWAVYSTSLDSRYGPFGGTSAAAPVTAGGVALTLAHFPHYTPFQAAQRVRVTTDEIYISQPYNLPYTDKMGTGRINLFRALTDSLKPSIRLTSEQVFNQNGSAVFVSGDLLKLNTDFINHLDPSTINLKIELEIPDIQTNNFVQIVQGDLNPGVVPMHGVFSNNTTPFLLQISANAPDNLKVNLRLRYSDSTLMYEDFEYVEFWVNPTFVNITQNKLHTSVGSQGEIGYVDFPANKAGLGVQYDGNEWSFLNEAGFMIGNSPTQISDNLRDTSGQQSGDFAIVSPMRLLTQSLIADQESEGVFDDSKASQPLGVKIIKHAYAWTQNRQKDYVILDYKIINTSGASINGLYAGILADWDLFNKAQNATSYSANDKFVYAFDSQQGNQNYVGIALLSAGSFRGSGKKVGDFSFGDNEKYNAIRSTPTNTNARVGSSSGGFDILNAAGTGPFNIAVGDTERVAFALVGGATFNEFVHGVRAAQKQYRCYILKQGPVEGFWTLANYAKPLQSLLFTSLSPTATAFHWDFGDGNVSTLQQASHAWAQSGNYTVIHTVSDGNCEIVSKRRFRVSPTVSVEQELGFEMKIWPNPSHGKLQLKAKLKENSPISIEISDLTGRLLLQKELPNTGLDIEHTLDLEDFSNGIYFYKILQSDISISRKFILKRN